MDKELKIIESIEDLGVLSEETKEELSNGKGEDEDE